MFPILHENLALHIRLALPTCLALHTGDAS
jgi:hypothetical protein